MVRDVIRLRPPQLPEGPLAPVLERRDVDFVSNIFRELVTPEGRAELRKTEARSRVQDALRLYRPVHRVFHVLLLEAYCERPGSPRLDPRRVHSAGLVIRRIDETEDERPASAQLALPARTAAVRYQAWMQGSDGRRGWIALGNARDEALDPDPALRPRTRSGNPELDRRLATMLDSRATWTESVVTLFPAPPAVCEAVGRTLLVGVLPTGSVEESEVEATTPAYERDEVASRIPPLLTASPSGTVPPRSGQLLTRADAGAADLVDFVDMLGKLTAGFGMLEEGEGPAALRSALQRLTVQDANGATRKLGDVIEAAANVLLFGQQGNFLMPQRWAAISSADAGAIVTAVHAAANQRLADIRPRQARFEDDRARYRARGFVRVRHEPDCPPELVWSDYSEVFRIAPWWNSGPNKPPVIALPDLTLDNLRQFKPNVAFKLPPRLFDLLQKNTPKKFLSADIQEGSVGLGIEWICGFSIPIITLCAFIVLFIFLVLLNLVFWWLPFVRICIPIPRKG